MAPPSSKKSEDHTTGMSAGMSAVSPLAAGVGSAADRPGHPRTPTMLDTVAETICRSPPGAKIGAFPPRRLGQRGSDGDAASHTAGSPGPTGSPIVRADFDVALSSFRESLLADNARVIAASSTGSAKAAPWRNRPAGTPNGRGKNKARRRRGSSPSSSSASSSSRLLLSPTRKERRPRQSERSCRSSSARKSASWAYSTIVRTVFVNDDRLMEPRGPERGDGRPSICGVPSGVPRR